LSRAAVFKAISEDPTLNLLDITADTVFPNWASKTRPSDTTPFIILRWQEETKEINMDGPRMLDVWVHIPMEISSDYGRLDEILYFVTKALRALIQKPGEDGFTVTQIIEHGKSADFYDNAYDTISRNASFGVLSHESTASELSLIETP
jgi:hypothetical protein